MTAAWAAVSSAWGYEPRAVPIEEVPSADDELLHGHGRAIVGDVNRVSCHGRRRSGSRCDIAQVLDQMGGLIQGSQSVGELLDADGLVADGNPSARETALTISWWSISTGPCRV
jgi:hypothetical protein